MTPNRRSRLRVAAWQKLLLISASSLALLVVLLRVQHAQADDPALVPAAPGSISGLVTDAGAAPQAGITVTLYQKSPYYGSEWYPVRSLETNAGGDYRFGLLSAGIYRVGFSGPSSRFAQNYYNNAPTVQEGQDIVIAGNNVIGINTTLAATARITGEITLAAGMATTASINGIVVPIYNNGDVRALRKVNGRWTVVKFVAYNDPFRSYTLDGLSSGVYRVCVSQYYYSLPPGGYGRSFGECYDNIGSGVDNAADITLATGETKPNINFVLGDASDLAQITGTVIGQDGAPLVDVQVTALLSQTYAYGANWSYVNVTRTNAAGNYRLVGLQPGLYTVLFSDPLESYVAEAYADAPVVPEWGNFAGATTFALQRYEVRPNINVALTRANHLVGAITLRDEGPPTLGEVQVYQAQQGTWQLVRNRQANPRSGAFNIGGLGAGVYKVTAYANPLGGYPYAGYYGGSNLDEATPITLTVNETRTHINIELTRITSGTIFPGEVNGIVTSTNGPLKDIQVTVYPAYCCPSPSPLVYVFTDAAGRYRINGLVDGYYYLRFSDPSGTYATTWNNNQRTPSFPLDMISVFGGAVFSDVNASLVRGGGISGNVRLRAGTPLLDIQVQVHEFRDGYYQYNYLQDVTTDANGNYTIQGLHPGAYQLCFIDPTYKYPQTCYGATLQVSYPGTGIDLIVEAGKTLSGIDQIMGPKLYFYLPFIGR